MKDVDLLYALLAAAYLLAVAWYIRATIAARQKGERGSSSSGRRHRRSRAGKKCPDCGKMIDVRRSLCQHCGHKFELPPGSDHHPDEVRRGIVPPSGTLPPPADKSGD